MPWAALGWLLFVGVLAGGVGFLLGMMAAGRAALQIGFWRSLLRGCPPEKRYLIVEAFQTALCEIAPPPMVAPPPPVVAPPDWCEKCGHLKHDGPCVLGRIG